MSNAAPIAPIHARMRVSRIRVSLCDACGATAYHDLCAHCRRVQWTWMRTMNSSGSWRAWANR